jgi:hypothetical protein
MSRGSKSVSNFKNLHFDFKRNAQQTVAEHVCLQSRHSSPALARSSIPNAPERCQQTPTWDEKEDNLAKVKAKCLSFLHEET